MTLVIDVKNDNEVLPTIRKWEAEHDIEILSTSETQQPKLSEKYRGKLSHETAEALLKEIEEGRQEWE